MTTTVIVQAHCDSAKKQVRVRTTDTRPDVVIQDGEKHELAVWDDVVVTVNEELKPAA